VRQSRYSPVTASATAPVVSDAGGSVLGSTSLTSSLPMPDTASPIFVRRVLASSGRAVALAAGTYLYSGNSPCTHQKQNPFTSFTTAS
jgi:hypothetical protein